MQCVNAGLITNLQLLVGHGGQSCHVEGEVACRSNACRRIRWLVEAHVETLNQTKHSHSVSMKDGNIAELNYIYNI